MRFSLADEATGNEEHFEFENGIRSFVEMLNADRHPLHTEVLIIRGEEGGVGCEVGLQWCQEREQIVLSFANDEYTGWGGTHVSGLRDAVIRSFDLFFRNRNLPDVRKPTGEEIRNGLTAVVSLRMARPSFVTAAKDELTSVEAQRAVREIVAPLLREIFDSEPTIPEAIVRSEPEALLGFLPGGVSTRKCRLFACACCRRIWRLQTDERSRSAVELAEEYADKHFTRQRISRQQLREVRGAAAAVLQSAGVGVTRFAATAAVDALRTNPDSIARAGFWAARAVAGNGRSAAAREGRAAERAAQAGLLRDILYSPFRRPSPVDRLCLAWNDGVVKRLAAAAYEERSLPDGALDTDRLAVLADALEDAGCTDSELLDHLRGSGPHVRGCWVIDLLLGRE
jgi:hypothetical protein